MNAVVEDNLKRHAAPSRATNAFATCWTKPGALTFRFPPGTDAAQLVARLAVLNWQGAIEGPHGSGKSTLIETLRPVLSAAGREVLAIGLHNGQRRLPPTLVAQLAERRPASARPLLVIVDGYEQLSVLERLRLARRCRHAGAGLLVTTHAKSRLPTLIRLAPDRALVAPLVADLCAQVSASIAMEKIAASHACHGSNVREIFFDLYDRYEQQRRITRTAGGEPA